MSKCFQGFVPVLSKMNTAVRSTLPAVTWCHYVMDFQPWSLHVTSCWQIYVHYLLLEPYVNINITRLSRNNRFVHVDEVRTCLGTEGPLTAIFFVPKMIWVWRTTVEWYWQRKRITQRKLVPVPLCQPQMPQGLIRARTPASAARGRRLTTWAIARPYTVC
jgi:hypothetical protein